MHLAIHQGVIYPDRINLTKFPPGNFQPRTIRLLPIQNGQIITTGQQDTTLQGNILTVKEDQFARIPGVITPTTKDTHLVAFLEGAKSTQRPPDRQAPLFTPKQFFTLRPRGMKA